MNLMRTDDGLFEPLRIAVCINRFVPLKRLKRQTNVKRVGYGFFLWREHQSYQEARLPSAGSFLFPGIVEARKAAMDALNLPDVHQVQVRTNQDKTLYIWNKYAGKITGYNPQ